MTVDYERFQWRELETGIWTRDIDEVETSYTALNRQWRGSGRSFFHMTGHLSLRIPIQSHQDRQGTERELDAALSKAWIALRFHHPTIASQVKLDHQAKKYVKAYCVSAEGWVEETFKIVTTGQSGVEWANNDPPAPPMPTLNVIVLPSKDDQAIVRDIVFRSPHDIIDGIGTLLLFKNYVRLASEAFTQGDSYQVPSLDDPQVIQNLSPPYRVAVAVPPQPSPAITQRLADLVTAEQADAPRNAEVVTLPFRKGAKLPGAHHRVEVVLSTEETSELISACKNVGATVTHVFHAAIALVLRNLQRKTSAARPVEYVGYLLRNERPSCNPPYNDHHHAAAVYHSISSDKLIVHMAVASEMEVSTGMVGPENVRDEFLRIVKQMKAFYLKVRDDPDHYCLAPFLWARGTVPLPVDPEEAKAIPPVPGPAEFPSVSISSMGRIDNIIAEKYGPIEVYNPWVTGEELRTGLGLFLGTFRGKLSLSAAYNDAWHDRDEVLYFIKSCIGVVNIGFDL